MKLSDSTRLRKLGKSKFLIGTGNALKINDTGERIYSDLKSGKNLNEIVESLADTYPKTSSEVLYSDVTNFISILKENGHIVS